MARDRPRLADIVLHWPHGYVIEASDRLGRHGVSATFRRIRERFGTWWVALFAYPLGPALIDHIASTWVEYGDLGLPS
jgi:hypothetical protein